jgi:penicillin V acylase-like amidase (Ntn superfamily)
MGKMVSHTGSDLPLKVLTNTSYAGSLMEWRSYLSQEETGRSVPAMGTSSRDRFVRAARRVTAFKTTDSETAVRTAFDILEDASSQKTGAMPPCWSIVFDAENLQVHFRTIVHTSIRTIDFRKMDFSCQTPAKMNDINERLSGDISDQLKDFSFDAHLDHAVTAGRKWGLEMTREELRELFNSYEKWSCLCEDTRVDE